MRIIPAIDLLDGQVVRLHKGEYSEKVTYNSNPLEQARLFRDAGFDHIHVVDLNGAKSGQFENLPHIKAMVDELGLSVQTGGGVRSLANIEQLLDTGITGVICSSMAVKKPEEWLQAIKLYPDQCILGMDLKDGKVAYAGWLETSDEPLESFLTPMIRAGLQTVLSTDISRDGTLAGPNTPLYVDLMKQFPGLNWIASGGVGSYEDLTGLVSANVYGVVVGKAYYEGKVSLEQLVALHKLND